ncbi:MAG: hypothetical protein HOO96_42385 [Polyangiaceae bacterium]|nr:hypothetical protein [Polyangiaceae bacterium]
MDPSATYCSTCCLELSGLPEWSEEGGACPLCRDQQRFASAHELDGALRRWASVVHAQTVSERDFRDFLLGTLVEADVAALFAAYQRGEPLAVVCDPFARAGGSPASVGPTSERAPTSERVRNVPLVVPAEVELPVQRFEPAPLEATPQIDQVPRALLYPLASVAAADGIVDVEERWYIDSCLKRYGLEPATDGEMVVYYPLDYAALIPPVFREALVAEMCAVAMIDGLPDAAEARMIYAYCTEWRIPEDYARAQLVELQRRNTSLARRAWLGFRNYLLPGRWENTKL